MTPAALRAEAQEHLRLAQEKLALADALDGAQQARPAETTWIPTGRAMQIMCANSESTVYRFLDRHPGVGVQEAPRKPWRIDEAKFRAALRGEDGEACGENGECKTAFTMR